MGRERIQGYIRDELHRWVKDRVTEGEFASESHAVEKALIFLRNYMEGKLLRK